MINVINYLMEINFSKYHGTGNDFILIDNRSNIFNPEVNTIKRLCDRHFGIGADGLILLDNNTDFDFNMVYFNSDGNQADMCGNGARCIIAFAKDLELIGNVTTFSTLNNTHTGTILTFDNDKSCYTIKVKLMNPEIIEVGEKFMFIDSGVPHHIEFRQDLEDIDFYVQAKKIRYDLKYSPEGTNVTFVELQNHYIFARTYERGIENETLSCGTGVTAAAIASFMKNFKQQPVNVKTKGGELKIHFSSDNKYFDDVWLEGPACRVFGGKINTFNPDELQINN